MIEKCLVCCLNTYFYCLDSNLSCSSLGTASPNKMAIPSSLLAIPKLDGYYQCHHIQSIYHVSLWLTPHGSYVPVYLLGPGVTPWPGSFLLCLATSSGDRPPPPAAAAGAPPPPPPILPFMVRCWTFFSTVPGDVPQMPKSE